MPLQPHATGWDVLANLVKRIGQTEPVLIRASRCRANPPAAQHVVFGIVARVAIDHEHLQYAHASPFITRTSSSVWPQIVMLTAQLGHIGGNSLYSSASPRCAFFTAIFRSRRQRRKSSRSSGVEGVPQYLHLRSSLRSRR